MTLPGAWRSSLDPERIMQLRVTHWQDNTQLQREDHLAIEEPLEVRIANQNLAVIMRTPGNDNELAAGFLLSEGIIRSADDLLCLENALDVDGLPLENVVNVCLQKQSQDTTVCAEPATFARHFTVSASCGLCGKKSIEDLLLSTPLLEADTLHISASVLYELANQLRAQQKVFSHTGGLHAAALFTRTGELQLLREDIGRHNAVDKLIGYGLLQRTYPHDRQILLVSGRTSFEIIQKALIARIPCVAAISAPSSLAVELADKGGITLIGFLRDYTMNVYTHTERIIP